MVCREGSRLEAAASSEGDSAAAADCEAEAAAAGVADEAAAGVAGKRQTARQKVLCSITTSSSCDPACKMPHGLVVLLMSSLA